MRVRLLYISSGNISSDILLFINFADFNLCLDVKSSAIDKILLSPKKAAPRSITYNLSFCKSS